MPKWTSADLPRMDGRTVVITGAGSGIGLFAARELAGVGATVVAAVRDPAKARPALARVAGSVEIRRLDVSDLGSSRYHLASSPPDPLIARSAPVPYLEASDHPELFVAHGFEEHLVDLGEVRLNYATAGRPDRPAMLLVPGQSEWSSAGRPSSAACHRAASSPPGCRPSPPPAR
jgi:hypothetical protein